LKFTIRLVISLCLKPETAADRTMGTTKLRRSRDVWRPVAYQTPAWDGLCGAGVWAAPQPELQAGAVAAKSS